MTKYTLAYVNAVRTMIPDAMHRQLGVAAAHLLQAGEARDADDAMVQACIEAVMVAHHRTASLASSAWCEPMAMRPAADNALLAALCDAVCAELKK